MGRIKNGIVKALETARNEREIQPYLKKNLLIVRNTLNYWAWNYTEVIPEFQVGNEYRADFLILSADSGSWHAVFVELKSHRARQFTKAGIPTKSLSLALRQLDDWERWLDKNDNAFRLSLSRHFEKKRVAAQCSTADSHIRAAEEIIDPRTPITKHYKVLLGRRSMLSKEENERRAAFLRKNHEILTYDRLLDTATKIDIANMELKHTKAKGV